MTNLVVLKAVSKQEVEEIIVIFSIPGQAYWWVALPRLNFKSSGRRPARGPKSGPMFLLSAGGVNLKFNTFYRSKYKTF